MSDPVAFTGERFIPGVAGEIAYEHWHRYAFARRFVAGKRVLDAACGEGYGSALLAETAAGVVGVDIDAGVIAAARDAYKTRSNLRYEAASVTRLPLADASIDVIVSFETIEHISADDQRAMLAEFARVLASDGVLVLSSPNKRRYSDARNYVNPFHVHELYRDDLESLLGSAFPARRWFRQAPAFVSVLWCEEGGGDAEALAGDGMSVAPMQPPEALYFVVVAAKHGAALPTVGPCLSLYADTTDSELARIDAQAREAMRLDELLRARDAALDRQTSHIQHLERLVATRERLVEERDRELEAVNAAREAHERALAAMNPAREAHERALITARDALVQRDADVREARRRIAVLEDQNDALQADQARLDAALAAQERIIAYRQSLRWWVRMPWLRLKLAWQRARGS
jgi:SAM-dependent methyltransferase